MEYQTIPLDHVTIVDNIREVTAESEGIAELAASIASLGVLQPITVADEGNGKYRVVTGHRRVVAARSIGETTIPALIDHSAWSSGTHRAMQIAENVARADLSPAEEAHAYAKLIDSGMTPIDVAKLVGVNLRTVALRLFILDLPESTQHRVDVGSVQLRAVPILADIAEHLGPRVCDAASVTLVEQPEWTDDLLYDPTRFVGDVLSVDWIDAEKHPDGLSAEDATADDYLLFHIYPAQTSHGALRGMPRRFDRAYGYGDPDRHQREVDWIRALLGDEAAGPVVAAWDAIPDVTGRDNYARDSAMVERRNRVWCLDKQAISDAQAYGAGHEWPRPEDADRWSGMEPVYFITDMAWLADQLLQNIERETRRAKRDATKARKAADTDAQANGHATSDDAEQTRKDDVAAKREEDYANRVSARRRNLDVGAKVGKWEPKIDVDTARFLALVLFDRGVLAPAVWGSRLTHVHPVKTAKGSGRETVQYPRTVDDRQTAVQAARKRILTAKTPEAIIGGAMRCLVANHLVDASGLPGADTGDRWIGLGPDATKQLDRIARRVAPRSVKEYMAEQQAAVTPDDDDGEGDDE